MNEQHLVESILQEVLQKLQKQRISPAKKIWVIGEQSPELEARLCSVLGMEYAFVYGTEFSAPDVAERIIVPFLSCSDMADLALGRADKALTHVLLRLLLTGKKIEVLEFEYAAVCQTASAALFDLYATYAQQLKSYGLFSVQPQPLGTVRCYKNLISEADISALQGKGVSVLQIRSNARVTALAEDSALLAHICIEKIL